MATSKKYSVRFCTHPPELGSSFFSPEWAQGEIADICHFHPASSTHRPETHVRILYSNEALYVAFLVHDCYVRAKYRHYQDPVYLDSCVEFFVKPHNAKGYFNFETNCMGVMLVSYVTDPTRTSSGLAKVTHLPRELAEKIPIYHSLELPDDREIIEPTIWSIQYSLPFFILEHFTGKLNPVQGSCWKGNFYKCAEHVSHPHWASWQPMAEELNFHRPDLFGDLYFS